MVTQDELAEIQQRYRVRERDWLELEIAYEGRGEAEFSTNPGTIGGPTSIRYGEDGTLELFQMTVDELAAEQHPGKAAPDALFVFVNALPVPGGFGFGGMSNECDVDEPTLPLRWFPITRERIVCRDVSRAGLIPT